MYYALFYNICVRYYYQESHKFDNSFIYLFEVTIFSNSFQSLWICFARRWNTCDDISQETERKKREIFEAKQSDA